MKKFICVVLTFSLLAAYSLTVFAEENGVAETEVNHENVSDENEFDDQNTETAYLVLNGLGIVNGYDDNKAHPQNKVTRAELTAMMVRLMLGTVNYNASTPFKDVADEYWGSSYINAAVNFNLIDGYPDGTFAPENNVRFEEAIKVVVCALGYDLVAQGNGGYPRGYMMVANQLKITAGINAEIGKEITRGELFLLLYQSLNVDLMENETIGVEQTEILKGTTLLTRFRIATGKVLINDVLTTIGKSSITGVSSYENHQVVIGGIEASAKENLPDYSFLGNQVIAVIDETNEADKKLISIHKTPGKNKTVTYDATDIISYSDFKYTVDNNGKRKTVVVPNEAAIVYNGLGLSEFSSEELNIKKGSISLLDSDANGIYDVVFLWTHDSYVVYDVNTETGTIVFLGLNGKPKTSIVVDVTDDEKKHYIYPNGNIDDISQAIRSSREVVESDFENIKKGDVISVLSSVDETTRFLFVNSGKISGKISLLDKENGKVTVGDTEYSLYKNEDGFTVNEESLKFGDTLSFFVNSFGEIVAIDNGEIPKDNQTLKKVGFAYVLEAGSERSTLMVRLLFGQQIDKEAEDHIINSQHIEIINLAKKVKVDDERVSKVSEIPVGKVVEYRMNDNGEITSLKTFSESEKLARKYYKAHMVFGNNTLNGAFVADNSTTFFVIPVNAEDDEDYEVIYKLADNSTHQTISVGELLTFGNTVPSAQAVVISATSNAHATGYIDDTTPVTLISSVRFVRNSNDDFVSEIKGFREGEEITLSFREDVDEDKQRTLKPGDVVKLAIDVDGNINDYELLARLSSDDVWYRAGARGKNERVFGKVYQAQEAVLSPVRGQLVNKIEVVFNEDFRGIRSYDVTDDILEKNLFVYNREEKSLTRMGEFSEITSYVWSGEDASSVFLYISMNDLKSIVIVE